jgi:hypothetical protein
MFVSDGTGGLNDGEPYFRPESNGTPVNLLTGTGGGSDLAFVLTVGNLTGGTDIVVSNGDTIKSEDSGAGIPGRNLVLAPGTVVDTNPGALLWGSSYASATRGKAAIDLQFARSSATNIVGADSSYSAIVGGRDNSISASGPVAERQANMGIFVGRGNTITGRDTYGAVIIGGQNNTIDGTRVVASEPADVFGSAIVGGYNNKIAGYASVAYGSGSGTYRAFIGGGSGNLIGENAYGSVVFGRNNTVDSRIGSPTQIFSVSYALVAGQNNLITGEDTVGGSYHSVCFGQNNIIRGAQDAFAFGNGNYVGGPDPAFADCSLVGGRDNIVRADMSVVWGRECIQHTRAWNSAGFGSGTYLYSKTQFALGAVEVGGTPGTAQLSCYSRRIETVSAAPVSIDSFRLVYVAADRTWGFRILASARQIGGIAGTVGDSATWVILGCIKRTGATTSFVGSPSGTGTPSGFNDAAAATWSLALTADDANETLQITATGETNKSINWHFSIFTTEVG